MKFKFILFYCCVLIYQQAKAINLNQDEAQYIGQTEKDQNYDFGKYIIKIRDDSSEYTGTLITGQVIVANGAVKADSLRVCFDDKFCTSPLEVHVGADDSVAYIYLHKYFSEPQLFKDDISAAKSCLARGVSRDSIPISINESKVDCKSSCQDYDAVVCDNKLAGIITGGPAFKLINVNDLLVKVNNYTLRKMYKNENKRDSVLKEEKDEEMDFNKILVNIREDGNEYTGTLITAKIAVASRALEKAHVPWVCTLDGGHCESPEKIDIDDNEGIAYIYFANKFTEPLAFTGNVSAAKSCLVGGLKHDPIPISINGSAVYCKTGCYNYDAVICDHKVAGIITGDHTFKLVNIGNLRAKLFYRRYNKAQDAQKGQNLLAETSGGEVLVTSLVTFAIAIAIVH